MSPTSSLISEGIATDPLVAAALAAPLPRVFEDYDEYVYCYAGDPVRRLTVTKVFDGVHPKESSYSFVWLPTVEQSTMGILRAVDGRFVVEYDSNQNDPSDCYVASCGRMSFTGATLRAAAYKLHAELASV